MMTLDELIADVNEAEDALVVHITPEYAIDPKPPSLTGVTLHLLNEADCEYEQAWRRVDDAWELVVDTKPCV
jgi:hypothetical protein